MKAYSEKSLDIKNVIFLFLLPWLFFWEVTILKQSFLWGDVLWGYYPLYSWIFQAIHSHQFSFWLPHIACGVPLVPQTAIFYPLNWFFFFIPTLIAYHFITILHYSLAGIFMFLFMRRGVGVRHFPALVSSITFMFSGFLIAHLGHFSILEASIWIPLIFLFVLKSFYRNRLIWTLLAGLTLGIQALAGHAQIPALTGLAILGYILSKGAWDSYRAKKTAPFAMGVIQFVIIVLIGLGLSAIQLLPTLEALQLSPQPVADYEYMTSFSLPGSYLALLIFPYILGAFRTGGLYPFSYWGVDNIVEFTGYIGIIPLTLAILSIFITRRKQTTFFFGLAVLALIITLGKYTPLYRLISFIPAYQVFRSPARYLFLFNFSVAILTGIALNIEWAPKIRNRVLIAAFGLILIAIISLVFPLISRFLHPVSFSNLAILKYTLQMTNPAYWVPILIICSSAGLLFLYHGTTSKLFTKISILGIIILDLYFFGAKFNPLTSSLVYRAESRPAHFLKADNDLFRISNFPFLSLCNILEADMLKVDYNCIHNISSIHGYTDLPSKRYNRILKGNPWFIDHSFLGRERRWLNLLNTKYVITNRFPHPFLILNPMFSKQVLPLEGNHPITSIVLNSFIIDQSVPHDSRVANISVINSDNESYDFPIRAGIHTAAALHADQTLAPSARHGKIEVSDTLFINLDGKPYKLYSYRAKIPFNKRIVPRLLELEYLNSSLYDVFCIQISLCDDSTGNMYPIALPQVPQLLDPSFKRVFSDNNVEIYENTKCLPRFWWAGRLIPVKDGIEAWRRLNSDSFEPEKETVVEVTQNETAQETIADTAGNQIKIIQYAPDKIKLFTKTNGESFLSSSEIYYPGWKVYIDGVEGKIHRTNYIFRGVFVPEGEHIIRMVYNPLSFKIGLIISGLAWIGLAIYFIIKKYPDFFNKLC